MIQLRKSGDRGFFDHGWLKTYHTFSFGDYFDPRHKRFASLRVINEDWVAAGGGFPTHPHRDMEIVTYIIQGALEHKDSMGTGSVIRPGDIQRMSAGTGVLHSEFNHSKTDSVHLLQIWILPEEDSIEPGYEQKFFTPESKTDVLKLIASRGGEEGSVTIHQDAKIYASILSAGKSLSHSFAQGRKGWLQLIRGEVELNGKERVLPGDGAAVSEEAFLKMTASQDSEFLFFDLT